MLILVSICNVVSSKLLHYFPYINIYIYIYIYIYINIITVSIIPLEQKYALLYCANLKFRKNTSKTILEIFLELHTR